MKSSTFISLAALLINSQAFAQQVQCGDTTKAFTCDQAQLTGADCQGDCNCLVGGGVSCSGFSDLIGNQCSAGSEKNVCFAENGPDCECR